MPITDNFVRLRTIDVFVPPDRQRKTIDTRNLAESIDNWGIMNPLIVRSRDPTTVWLVAGERRLTAAKELGHLTVPCRFVEDLSSIEIQILELEENIKRQDLPWQDSVMGMGKIHQLYVSMDPNWSGKDTARALGLSAEGGWVAKMLIVHRNMGDPKISSCGGMNEAHNIILRREQRQAGEALQDLLDIDSSEVIGTNEPQLALARETAIVGLPKQPEPETIGPVRTRFRDPLSILNENFLQWARHYSGPKFNLIHCDFPYGIGVFEGQQGSKEHHGAPAYDDSPDVYFSLLEGLLSHLDRLMSISGHLVFWYSRRHEARTMEMFNAQAPNLVFQPFPLIWLKSDNVGIASDPQRSPRHVYESALMATRGNRKIVRLVADAYVCPTDKRFHPSTKPEPMLKHFFQMFVDENTRMLDPTCGSGSALRACESLGGYALGIEQDENICGLARTALRASRNLRTLGPVGAGL